MSELQTYSWTKVHIFKTFVYYLTYSEVSRGCFYAICLFHTLMLKSSAFEGSCFSSVYITLKSSIISVHTKLHFVFGFQHYQQNYLPLALILISSSIDAGIVTPNPAQILCRVRETLQGTEGQAVLFPNNTQHTCKVWQGWEG